jgi:hypothetical protein
MCLFFGATVIITTAAVVVIGPYNVMASPDRTEATVRYNMPGPQGVGTRGTTSQLTSSRRNSLADAAVIMYTAVWTPQVSYIMV